MEVSQLRLGVRGALLLAVCGLFFETGCSFLVDSQGQQCKSDIDCARRGQAFANFQCVHSVCVNPGGVGGTSSESSGGNSGGNASSSLPGSSDSGGAVGGSTVDARDAGSSRDATSGSSETGNDSPYGDAGDAGRNSGVDADAAHDHGVDSDARDAGVDAPVDANRSDSDGSSADASRWSEWNAYLPLASGSTTNGDPGTTPDVSGHGYIGAYGRGVSFANSTLIMSGGGDVSIPSQNSIPAIDLTASYSISVWITMTATTGWRTFLSAEGTQVSEFYLQKRSDTSHFAFTLSTADNNEGVSQPCIVTSSIAPLSGVRYHLVATRDATTGVNTLYVNGAVAGTATCTISRGVAWPANTFGLGHGMYNGLPTDYFAGSMSAVGLMARVLSDAEVAALFAQGPN
jgi:hypothetical protein